MSTGTEGRGSDLEKLLEAYGADPGRWPEGRPLGDRATPSKVGAEAAFRESLALDQLLERARVPDRDAERLNALTDRICAVVATEAEERGARPQRQATQEPGTVVTFPSQRRSTQSQTPAWMRPAVRIASRIPAAALLAASLAIGVGIGMYAPASATFGDIAARIGVVDSDAQIAGLDGILSASADDLL